MRATIKQSRFIPGFLLGLCAGIALALSGLYLFLDVGRWSHNAMQAGVEMLMDELAILERTREERADGPLTALEERLDSAIIALGVQISHNSDLATPEATRALKQVANYRARYPFKSAPELESPVAKALALSGEAQ